MTTGKKASAKSKPRPVKQVIGTRVKITLDDTPGNETLTLKTPQGQTITIGSARGTVEISDGQCNSIKFEPAGITIQAAGRVTVNATEVKVRAANLVVDAALAKFNGAVQCDTLISNSVVSASYTPGVGNVF